MECFVESLLEKVPSLKLAKGPCLSSLCFLLADTVAHYPVFKGSHFSNILAWAQGFSIGHMDAGSYAEPIAPPPHTASTSAPEVKQASAGADRRQSTPAAGAGAGAEIAPPVVPAPVDNYAAYRDAGFAVGKAYGLEYRSHVIGDDFLSTRHFALECATFRAFNSLSGPEISTRTVCPKMEVAIANVFGDDEPHRKMATDFIKAAIEWCHHRTLTPRTFVHVFYDLAGALAQHIRRPFTRDEPVWDKKTKQFTWQRRTTTFPEEETTLLPLVCLELKRGLRVPTTPMEHRLHAWLNAFLAGFRNQVALYEANRRARPDFDQDKLDAVIAPKFPEPTPAQACPPPAVDVSAPDVPAPDVPAPMALIKYLQKTGSIKGNPLVRRKEDGGLTMLLEVDEPEAKKKERKHKKAERLKLFAQILRNQLGNPLYMDTERFVHWARDDFHEMKGATKLRVVKIAGAEKYFGVEFSHDDTSWYRIMLPDPEHIRPETRLLADPHANPVCFTTSLNELLCEGHLTLSGPAASAAPAVPVSPTGEGSAAPKKKKKRKKRRGKHAGASTGEV